MENFLNNKKGLNIVGQGGKIILFTLPFLVASIWAHIYLPGLTVLPKSLNFLAPIGFVLLAVGVVFWATAVLQLLSGFYKSRLITTGAYGLVRNPIYSSMIFFILPAIAMLTLSWAYLVVSLALYVGVIIFIRTEEKELLGVFGEQYQAYMQKVDRLVPFIKPIFKSRDDLPIFTKLLIFCGLLSSVFYVASDLMASWWYDGYNILNQNFSELLATGAPTRPVMLISSSVFNLLLALFAAGVWLSKKGSGKIRTATGIAIMIYAIGSMITPMYFQMDLRGAPVTQLGSLHPLMTAIMSVFILLSIGLGGFMLEKWFKVYSFATIAILLAFGVITSLQAPALEAGLVTPWMGLTERVNIYATMVWFAFFSIKLLRKGNNSL